MPPFKNKFSFPIKEILAIIFGLFLCIILILGTEWILSLTHSGEKPSKVVYPKGYHIRDSNGIQRAAMGDHSISMYIKKTKKTIYQTTYSIDEYGRRITPIADRARRNKFAIFTGCSFTFGEGVQNNQTLAYHLGKNTKTFMPYNYGMHGHGPLDNLAKIENINYEQEIEEHDGIIVYTFIEAHIPRVIGSMRAMAWKAEDPYYIENSDGKLTRQGTFRTHRPILTPIYKFLNESRILRALKIDFPLQINSSDIELTAKAIEAMRDRFLQQYPNAKFYALIYPGSLYDKKMIEKFKEKNIGYLDYSRLFNDQGPPYYIHEEDKHPSPLAYETLAKQLIQDLHLN